MAETWDRKERSVGIADRITNLTELRTLVQTAKDMGLSGTASISYPEPNIIKIEEIKTIEVTP